MDESERDRIRTANRERMPQAAAFLDSMRAAFGADVKATYVRENGFEFGKRDGGECAPPLVGPPCPPESVRFPEWTRHVGRLKQLWAARHGEPPQNDDVRWILFKSSTEAVNLFHQAGKRGHS